MTVKSFKKALENPKDKASKFEGVKGMLGRLFWMLVNEYGITEREWDRTLSKYVNNPVNVPDQQPSKRDDRRNNLTSALAKDRCTWLQFVRGLKAIDTRAFKMVLETTRGDDLEERQVELKIDIDNIPIPLVNEDEIDADIISDLPTSEKRPVHVNDVLTGTIEHYDDYKSASIDTGISVEVIEESVKNDMVPVEGYIFADGEPEVEVDWPTFSDSAVLEMADNYAKANPISMQARNFTTDKLYEFSSLVEASEFFGKPRGRLARLAKKWGHIGEYVLSYTDDCTDK